MSPRCIVAAALRAQCLVLTVLSGGAIIEVRRFRVPGSARLVEATSRFLRDTAADFDASLLVVEPGTPCCKAAISSGLDTRRLSVAEAMDVFVKKGSKRTQSALFDHILADEPRAARLVRLVPGSFRVAMTERKKNVSLLSIALGLAVARNI